MCWMNTLSRPWFILPAWFLYSRTSSIKQYAGRIKQFMSSNKLNKVTFIHKIQIQIIKTLSRTIIWKLQDLHKKIFVLLKPIAILFKLCIKSNSLWSCESEGLFQRAGWTSLHTGFLRSLKTCFHCIHTYTYWDQKITQTPSCITQ